MSNPVGGPRKTLADALSAELKLDVEAAFELARTLLRALARAHYAVEKTTREEAVSIEQELENLRQWALAAPPVSPLPISAAPAPPPAVAPAPASAPPPPAAPPTPVELLGQDRIDGWIALALDAHDAALDGQPAAAQAHLVALLEELGRLIEA